MTCYPGILLPRQSYPMLENDDVRDNVLARETTVNVYQLLDKTGYEADDILPFVVAPQPSLREVFELSVFLYGYYEEHHAGIHADDAALYTDWNKDMPELRAVDIKFSQKKAWLLFLARIPRDRSNAHTKYMAKSILEYIIAEVVVSKSYVKYFKRDDFEHVG